MVASTPPALAEALVQAQLKQLGALPKLTLPETVRRFPPGFETTLNPWIRFFNVPPSVHMARLAAFIMASGSFGAIVGFACGCGMYRALVQGKDSVLSGKISAMLARYRAKMRLSNEGVEAFQQDFLKQMEGGLPRQNGAGPNGDPYGSSLLMLPSFVTRLPSGMETGQFFAIDLGGTNFRMQSVGLSARRSEIDRDISRGTEIPEHLYSGTTAELFDFLATSLVEFAREEAGWRPGDANPVVGFCFSFPMHQTALNKASLIQWTKGFTCSGGVGKDPVELLSAALARAGMPSKVAAVLNDTIGVWAAHRYRNAATAIGLILGTGSNACYVEREGGETVIDIEWGGFSSATVPRIEEDEQLDDASPNAGEMQFEKLFSGLYLGEIARRILLKVLGEIGFSPATLPAPITTPGAFASATVSAIVEDRSWNLATTRKLLRRHLEVPQELLPILTRAVREICELVAMRGVDLVAAALVAVVRRGGRYKEPGECVVAVDGSVYEKFHSFRQQLRGRAEQLLARLPQRHPGFKLVFEMESSSCMGAAVLAAAATAS